MRQFFAVVPLVLLAGCSSFRPDVENITPVPEDRLLAYQEDYANGGSLVVNRDMGVMGGGCYVAIEVDRKLAARIGMAEVARFEVPAGTRVLGLKIDPLDDTLCGMGRLNKEVAVKVAPGSTQYFHIVSENRGGFDIRPDANPPQP
ncbi:3-isopropylmalate dehydratase [Pseudomonas sp. PDM16]|uniref:3-isopropylmalate dehydratase n=1 Tax=Pseudomonas sp. PDM16 TaxID=2769292 RepID=UPI00178265F4|nr:3-isopropylmalate dehydratase [Pseudomonas sp. PDM16]MBD9414665.1 3-isopropylmalate dehydratase [Pseudomonas sp. PDM16]